MSNETPEHTVDTRFDRDEHGYEPDHAEAEDSNVDTAETNNLDVDSGTDEDPDIDTATEEDVDLDKAEGF